MLSKKAKKDIIAGFILILFSGLIYFIIPFQVGGGAELGELSGLFPKIAAGIICALSLILIFSNLRKKNRIENLDDHKDKSYVFKRVTKSLGIIFGFVFIIDIFGFILSTIVFLVVFMKFFGEKSWLKIIVSSIVTTIALYFLMKILYIPIPTGTIFMFD